MKVKKIILIIVFFILVALGTISVYLNSKSLSFDYDESIEVALHQELKNLDNIRNLENGTILTEEEVVDTSKLGSYEVHFEIEDFFGRVKEYSYTVHVQDLKGPVIQFNELVTTEVGVEVDLLKEVKVLDNSLEEITPIVEGEYDITKEGDYTLYYVAKDSSGNETRNAFTLRVNKPKEVPSTNQGAGEQNNVNGSNNSGSTGSSSGNSGNSSSTGTKDGTFTTSKGFKGETRNGVTYIDGYMVVNKTYPLPSNYGSGLTKETLDNFNKMRNAATLDGLNIYISSGFRSYTTQSKLYNNYVKRDGKAAADTYSARAGHSEHQSGLAFDVNIINDTFATTPEAKWLAANCYKYGFILRYPQGKSNETGYKYESWHFRYVGTELAAKLYNNGNWITMEDYFGITSEYQS